MDKTEKIRHREAIRLTGITALSQLQIMREKVVELEGRPPKPMPGVIQSHPAFAIDNAVSAIQDVMHRTTE